ncbi:hypothetical protein BIY26_09325 [Brenneria goodwinii]|uniref:Uncharacterized protein n=1 Tax=Brenneria goodwinii TaxID=1109412 RepID=A0AAE8EPE5_9GAMM|nr:hypothetical protein [Brenneria goodwinii]ATA23501.1 hypothetical protein AWC36_04945 [Brenneria goodwinii]RLM25210.1 hypothetical protein BIY26_09325 [Brenneria goodwinii]
MTAVAEIEVIAQQVSTFRRPVDKGKGDEMANALTYEEITRIATQQITGFMANSKSCADSGSDLYRDWAVGAYFLWHRITAAMPESDADDARLKRQVGLDDD